MYYVYKIMNKNNGKYYVGRTKNVNVRFEQHLASLKDGKHSSIYLQNAWDKYGEVNFDFAIHMSKMSLQESIELEQYFLDNCRDEIYNLSYCATGGDMISYHPRKKEIITKRSETQRKLNRKLSKEKRREIWGKIGKDNPMFNHAHTKSTRNVISEKLKKYYEHNSGYRKGKTFEELFGEEKAQQMRKRISEVASERTGEKNPFFGKEHSQKTKEKIREARLGKKPVNQRPVIIDDIEYPSATEAARQLGVVPATILHRIKSKNKKYDGYFYKSEEILYVN